MPTQDVTTVGERLVRGVLDHRVLSLIYHGERRIVEAYLVGLHEAGEPVLVGYQTGGGSRSGELPGWRKTAGKKPGAATAGKPRSGHPSR